MLANKKRTVKGKRPHRPSLAGPAAAWPGLAGLVQARVGTNLGPPDGRRAAVEQNRTERYAPCGNLHGSFSNKSLSYGVSTKLYDFETGADVFDIQWRLL